MVKNPQVASVTSVIITALSFGLAGYLTIKGAPIPDWLTLLIGGGAGGSLISVGHYQGAQNAANAAAAASNGTNGNTHTTPPTTTQPGAQG